MIESIEFKNFKALRKAKLPLGPLTMLVGPNGSGKSTVLQALQSLCLNLIPPPHNPGVLSEIGTMISVGLDQQTNVEVTVRWGEPWENIQTKGIWTWQRSFNRDHVMANGVRVSNEVGNAIDSFLRGVRVFWLETGAIAQPYSIQPNMEIGPNGSGLVGVLDQLKDQEPERFEALNKEIGRWLPEYDRLLLQTPAASTKVLSLRTREGRHAIPAWQLSQGTLLSLAMLTLAHLAKPPTFIGLEEPDRCLHPRLLRDLRDALYRLAFPNSYGEVRQPVQVLVTTHSPYFLDLFRDHPEHIVIADKVGLNVRFQRLTELQNFEEILGDSPLGEVWYSGILGGVPTAP
jgi:predicted ATPase